MLGKMELELAEVINESMLFERSSEVRFLSFPKLLVSKTPLKLFEERTRYLWFTSLNIELGIDPCNSFMLKSIYSNESNRNSPI